MFGKKLDKTLFKSGNSYALRIDKALMRYTKITEHTPLELRIQNDTLLIRKKGSYRTPPGIYDLPEDDAECEQSADPGKHLFKNGHSYAIIIDRFLLESLDFTPDTVLELRPYIHGIAVRKRKWSREEEQWMKEQDEVDASVRIDISTVNENYVKTPSEKLILKDGKWVLIENPTKEEEMDSSSIVGGITVSQKTKEILGMKKW